MAQNPGGAAELVKKAAESQAALEASDRARVEARISADAIYVDDSDERSKASLGITAGAGLFRLCRGKHPGRRGRRCLRRAGHRPPVLLEHRAGAGPGQRLRAARPGPRLWGSVAVSPLLTVEGLVTARYFFGFFGIGVAGDFRFIQWTPPNELAQSKVLVGVGPSLSVALIDNRRTRLILGAHWTPFISSDWGRVTGDVEFSYHALSVWVVAGRASDGPLEAQRSGFFVGAFAGIRYPW